MAITFNTVEHLAKITKSGTGTFMAAAGQSLKIETSPDGEEILDTQVPNGKVWEVRVSVNITETNEE